MGRHGRHGIIQKLMCMVQIGKIIIAFFGLFIWIACFLFRKVN
jgi:hypothetical protein